MALHDIKINSCFSGKMFYRPRASPRIEDPLGLIFTFSMLASILYTHSHTVTLFSHTHSHTFTYTLAHTHTHIHKSTHSYTFTYPHILAPPSAPHPLQLSVKSNQFLVHALLLGPRMLQTPQVTRTLGCTLASRVPRPLHGLQDLHHQPPHQLHYQAPQHLQRITRNKLSFS